MGYSPPAGDVYDLEWTGTGYSIHHDGPMGQSTVVVDGVDTGVRVDFDTSPDGVISNVRPASESDAQQLEQITGISITPSVQAEQSGPYEPESVDTGAIDFQPINETPPRDLTPEELALAFGHDPTPAAPPELPIDTSIEAPVTNAPTTPPPTSAEPEPAEAQTPVATDIVPPTPNPHPPVAPPPSSPAPVSPPGSPTSMPTVQAPAVPNVPPLTPPLVDNSSLTNPQVPSGNIGSSVLEGGSNDNPSGGTPGFEHPGTGDSTNTPPSTMPVALPDILNREATQEAHHIIPHGSSRSDALRDQLADLGIDINAAVNGVWLPKNPDVDNPDGRTTHNQTFRRTYFAFLTRQFEGITDPEVAAARLESIREGLESGELQFELQP